jgi:lipoprotein-anchoring transpeptidase ErfK/SrfK
LADTPPFVARRTWWRRGSVLALVILALVSITAIVRSVANRREAEMAAAAVAARAAVLDARAAEAATWAPIELQIAERSAREALTAQRIQERRLWPLPDAAQVVAAFGATEQAAKLAAGAARERRDRASGTAASSIDAAHSLVSASEALADRLRVGRERRSLLASARLAVEEARVYQRAGDFRNASLRALRAKALNAMVEDHAAAAVARYADPDTVARWQRWKNDTIAWSRREGRPAIVVFKETHLLTLFVNGAVVKTYKIDLGFNWTADKAREGDGATPEGRYRVVSRASNGRSVYYKSLRIDYPNDDDRDEFARARRTGAVPGWARIGGLIEIHGGGGRGQDWTSGCVAVANRDMDELFSRVNIGTPVTIIGSDDYGAIAEFASQQRGASGGHQP